MKRILVMIALWITSAGAVLWAPWIARGDGSPPAPVAKAYLPPVHEVRLARDDEPATWTMVLVGAAVLCFIAARRVD